MYNNEFWNLKETKQTLRELGILSASFFLRARF